MVMNLLFASSYTDLGGGETALVTLAQHLDPVRFRPHLLVPREGQLSARWREFGWPVHVATWRGATVYFIPALWAQLPFSVVNLPTNKSRCFWGGRGASGTSSARAV